MTSYNRLASDTYLHGQARNPKYNKNGLPDRGGEVSFPYYYDYGAITAADRDGLVTSVNPAADATLTLRATVTGMTNTAGVVTFDTPRNVTIYGTADESAKTLTLTGTDILGAAMTETITGPDGTGAAKIAFGNKAFKTISSAVASGNFGTIEVGFGNKIGLPFHVANKSQALAMRNSKAADASSLTGTITALGTAQNVAVISPNGGVITKLSAVSAAGNTAGADDVLTVTNATLEVGVLTFTGGYTALDPITDATLLNTDISPNGVLKIAAGGAGDGAGQATVSIEISTAVVTVADDNTATATTGDSRGTINFGGGIDSTNRFGVWMMPNRTTNELLHGVTPA